MSSPLAVATRVSEIVLRGAPVRIFLDQEAEGAVGSAETVRIHALLAALGLDVVRISRDVPAAGGVSVAVLGADHAPIPGCCAWFVGAGAEPDWMNPTPGRGPRTTVEILSLLGMGFAQERAGAAFRAAGAGRAPPRSVRYDARAMLAGVTAAIAPRGAAPVRPPDAMPLLGRRERRELLARSADALDRCCAANGAIAAAPRAASDREPDYWFFWQRDAAHVAVALRTLAQGGSDGWLRERARARLDGYVDFVGRLGPRLAHHPGGVATSRCRMDGTPVEGYGDPQTDGPAATALALLAAVDDGRVALGLARPFLAHLVTAGDADVSFDLWELTVGRSFHATNLTRRALRRAAQVASAVDDPAASAYLRAATAWTRQVDTFRGPGARMVHVQDPHPAWLGLTSRLDMSVAGSVLLDYDVADDVANVDDPDVAGTVDALEQHFTEHWPVNTVWRSAGRTGCGIGRFPEDCNDGVGSTGGNPWPLATLWAAQHHLRRAERAAHRGAGDRAGQHEEVALGLGYLSFVVAHSGVDEISEQMDSATGAPVGARPLAWAHAELVITLLALEDALGVGCGD